MFIVCHLFILFLTCLKYVFYIFLYPSGLLCEIQDLLLYVTVLAIYLEMTYNPLIALASSIMKQTAKILTNETSSCIITSQVNF